VGFFYWKRICAGFLIGSQSVQISFYWKRICAGFLIGSESVQVFFIGSESVQLTDNYLRRRENQLVKNNI
jgi:hypothetical protein